MAHPMFRPRRLREKPLLRKLVRETVLSVDDLIYPLFIVHGRGVREPLGSMPGQFHLSIDEMVKDLKDVASMGIPASCCSACRPTRTRAARKPTPTTASCSRRCAP
jgi:porphobilinogen synthase